MRRARRLIVATTVVGGLITSGMTVAPAKAAEKIIAVNENTYGNTYGEWSAEWWQWALSIPAADSPITDPTGAKCTQQQSGPIFYLAGTNGDPALTPVTRTCTVPGGKALFFPILNSLLGRGSERLRSHQPWRCLQHSHPAQVGCRFDGFGNPPSRHRWQVAKGSGSATGAVPGVDDHLT